MVARPAVATREREKVLLIGWMVAGVQTQYEHLKLILGPGAGMTCLETHPYIEGGLIERLPVSSTIRGTIRSTLTLTQTLRPGLVKAVWTQVALPLLPFALTKGAVRRIPIFYAIDCTPSLLYRFAGEYPGVTDPDTPKGRLTEACLRLFFRRCAGLLPWSHWAARSMIDDYGVSAEKVHVVTPGIDLGRWKPVPKMGSGKRVQLLFVGGDFDRKGGPLLLDLFRNHLSSCCDLHMVTPARVESEPGVTVYHGFAPDDTGLLELYQRCDVLVLPTRADCFSMAAIEAMACGIPVVISGVGGIREIVEDGHTGALVEPRDESGFLKAIQMLVAEPGIRAAWGAAGRKRALERFDAQRQAELTASIMAGLPRVPQTLPV